MSDASLHEAREQSVEDAAAARADLYAMRAGQVVCACPPTDGEALIDNRVTLAIGFGLAVLAQALTLAVLPEQSRLMATAGARIGWPFALLLVGAALASFPAALLVDAFGRRAALSLGASLGVAGGVLAALAVTRGNFAWLCLGAFWLGLAQGFALFYRHVAAQGSARGSLIVLAGGAGAALAAPLVVRIAPGAAATLLAAAALHVAALALSVRMPHRIVAGPPIDAQRPARGFYLATAAGAFAWFGMAAGMLHGPLTLAVCSAAPTFIGGAMGWHLFAMYGPAAVAARWPRLFAPAPAIIGGLLVMLAGGAAISAGAGLVSVAAGLVALGAGWSAINVGTLRLLHDGPPLSRQALALHDIVLLSAAAAGALLLGTR